VPPQELAVPLTDLQLARRNALKASGHAVPWSTNSQSTPPSLARLELTPLSAGSFGITAHDPLQHLGLVVRVPVFD